MKTAKRILLYVMAVIYVLAGLNHFHNPAFYLRIMPPYLPLHLELVYASGAAEVLLGVLLVIPRTRRLAAWGVIALLVAVFPANIHMLVNSELYPEIPEFALWVRVKLQFMLISWAFWYTRR